MTGLARLSSMQSITWTMACERDERAFAAVVAVDRFSLPYSIKRMKSSTHAKETSDALVTQ